MKGLAKTRWVIFNRKIALLIAGAVIILGLLSFKAVQYWQQTRINPEELLSTALHNTMNARSFCFKVHTELGREDTASTVTGRRVAPNRVHIKGKLQNTQFELVHIGDKTYFKESLTGRWFTLTGNRMVDSELFVELNPLGNFNFKDIPEINYRGMEKVGQEKLALVEMRPNVNNQFLQMRYNDFFYRVWIDPETKLIRKAIVEATGINGENDKMKIGIELWDYNKQMKISPPEKEDSSPSNLNY